MQGLLINVQVNAKIVELYLLLHGNSTLLTQCWAAWGLAKLLHGNST